MKVYDEDKFFRCFYCVMFFNVVDNLKFYVVIYVFADGELICLECGKKFFRIVSLKVYIMFYEKEENLMCIECGDEFSF